MCLKKPKKPKADMSTLPPSIAMPEYIPNVRAASSGPASYRGSYLSSADAFAYSGRASPFRISLFQERA